MSATQFPLSIEEREGLIQIYSDFHKDVYGFRPRYDYPSFSDEQLVADFDRFEEVCKENAEHEARLLEAKSKEWDALIEKTIEMGAGDYKTALRWIVQGAEDYDAEGIVWGFGLLFSDKGREIVKDIEEHCLDILQKAWAA
jgi:hypothetical protein